ncbi:hypothetical protein [Capnocytophaga gingivalis]|uniref:hypothetical protein n=1 Tax=Capnocytophaga gingivalis TaxID=1017 RepID=UPI00288ABA3C|nr:hypothetical protein [Capnocytophaga gingivalis]
MREQAIQILLEIAQGTAQKQGEKIVYPTIRERLAAIKLLATMEGWNKPQKKTAEKSQQKISTPPAKKEVISSASKEVTTTPKVSRREEPVAQKQTPITEEKQATETKESPKPKIVPILSQVVIKEEDILSSRDRLLDSGGRSLQKDTSFSPTILYKKEDRQKGSIPKINAYAC